MAKAIFFSWQADTPTRIGRNFLRETLEEACASISSDTTLDEALREVEVDSDTQGVAGQPPIAETIFKKIDAAAVFVADMTFTGKRIDDRPTPNPNVLIEYGWALKTLKHDRVICIMNSVYGKPSRDTLPFDLAHLRWPIEYNLPDGASVEEKADEKRKLVKILKEAIRASLATVPAPLAETPPGFPSMVAKDGPARFRSQGEPIGIQDDFFDDVEKDIYFGTGPAMWLRVMPKIDSGKRWQSSKIKELSMKGMNLMPLFFSAGGYSYVRGPDGEGVYRAVSQGEKPVEARIIAPSLSYAFETGEVWSVDMVLYGYEKESIYFDQIAEAYRSALTRYAQFLRDLGVVPPFQWEAGMIGASRRRLRYSPPPGRQWAHGTGRVCLNDLIVAKGEYDGEQDPNQALAPFFDEIFTRCGIERPDYLR